LSDFEHHCLLFVLLGFLLSYYFFSFFTIWAYLKASVHSSWPDWSMMIIGYCNILMQDFLLLFILCILINSINFKINNYINFHDSKIYKIQTNNF
jgi:hypothetical protein